MKNLEICKMLILSTGHIKCKTANWLDCVAQNHVTIKVEKPTPLGVGWIALCV